MQTSIFQQGFTLFFILHMVISIQQKPFCVLQFFAAKLKSVISVQHFVIAVISAKNIRCCYKQLEEAGCLNKKKSWDKSFFC